MALVTTRELFADAQKNGYAIGAFNVENMDRDVFLPPPAREKHINEPCMLPA